MTQSDMWAESHVINRVNHIYQPVCWIKEQQDLQGFLQDFFFFFYLWYRKYTKWKETQFM